LILFAILCSMTAIVGSAGELVLEYGFEKPLLSRIEAGGVVFDRVTIPGCTNGGLAGEPALPARGTEILLPLGAEVRGVDVITGKGVLLGSGLMVEPVAQPVPLFAGAAAAVPPTPDLAIYQSALPFPAASFTEMGTHGFRGFPILVLRLMPVQYLPATGELVWYPNLEVRVRTADTGNLSPLYRGLPQDEAELLTRVDNPQTISSYAGTGRQDGRAYRLLILTTDSLSASFTALKNYHDARGIPTEIHTTTEVGSTDPGAVRDYIRQRYQSDGIEYVLIGGDDDLIPARNLYVDGESTMPGDIYFACLDGTWNGDGDNRYGEPNDGDGGGDVDLVAEVYVGRCAAGNAAEVNRFVTKTLWYLNSEHGRPEQVLLVGEYLGFGGPSEYAADTMEELIDGCSTHGYSTTGIPSSEFTIGELFERDGDWSRSDLAGLINDGVHILNHLGHGSPDYAMKFYNDDVLNYLDNEDLCFVYSQTCLAGHFDDFDCWAEHMNIKTDAGAFAVVMNARYGYGAYSSTDGPSQRFNREFWDAVFAEGMPQISKANQDSKEDNIYRINEECMRWCTYELNLFGDPTVAFSGAEATGLSISPRTELEAAGMAGGPFSPSSITYTLENMNATGIDYTVSRTQPWVTLSSTSGHLAGGASAAITVSINSAANDLGNGLYSDTVSFVNTTDHDGDTTRGVSLQVGIPTTQYSWNLDSDPGWEMEGGASGWAWGPPTGGGGTAYGNPDPTGGHSGSNVLGYNLNGDYPADMAEQHLTSTAFDCSGLTLVALKYWRHLNVETSSYDHAYVRVSTDGSNWTTVWENPGEITDSAWTEVEHDLSAVADGQSTVYVRWTMGTTDGGWEYSGWNIDDIEIYGLTGSGGGGTSPVIITGPGEGPDNVSDVHGYLAFDTSSPSTIFDAYGVDRYGVNVAVGNVDVDTADEIITGPGPGAIFGPQVRIFDYNGTPLPGSSAMAYGTNKYGVNVAGGDIDGDGYAEIITGAGPGAVFGPHVRAFGYDNSGTLTPVAGVNYFAYGVPKWGVNVACGDIDGDGFDEIVTGAGPGAVYGAHVRGWNVDDGVAATMPGVNFLAYGTPKFGVNVACGDIDGDGCCEIITGPGPGVMFSPHVRAWNCDGSTVSAIGAINFFAFDDLLCGASVGAGDVDGDARAELLVGAGPDRAAPAIIRVYSFDGGSLSMTLDFQAYPSDTITHGVNVTAGRF
jgi:hypothetical protein